MNTDPADEIRWFEALGGVVTDEADVADAVMLRRLLAPAETVVADLHTTHASWPRLRQRLLDELAAEDRQWFEAVGGAAEETSAVAGEGRRLRAVLAQDVEDEPALAGASTQAELLRRLAALAPPAPPQRRRGWLPSLFGNGPARSGWAFAALLALVVGIGVFVQQEPPEHERERERGTTQAPRIGPTGAPTFDVIDPQVEANQLVQAFAAAGINADASDQGGYWVVRALLPDPLGAEAARLLRERQLEVPPDRLLEVVFTGKR